MPYFQETELPKETSSASPKDHSLDVSQEEDKNMKTAEVATVDIKSGGSSPRLAIENGNSSPVSPEVIKKLVDNSGKNQNGISSSSSPPLLVKPITSPTVENDFKTIKIPNPTSLLNQLQNSNQFL